MIDDRSRVASAARRARRWGRGAEAGPVYTYLKNLLPPSEDPAKALGEPEHSGGTAKTAAASSKPAAESPTLAVLIQEGEKAIANDQFTSAKTFFATALNT